MKPTSSSKLLPNDRLELRRLHLQVKMAEKQKQREAAAAKKSNDGDDSESDDDSDRQELAARSHNKFGSLSVVEDDQSNKNNKNTKNKKADEKQKTSSSSAATTVTTAKSSNNDNNKAASTSKPKPEQKPKTEQSKKAQESENNKNNKKQDDDASTTLKSHQSSAASLPKERSEPAIAKEQQQTSETKKSVVLDDDDDNNGASAASAALLPKPKSKVAVTTTPSEIASPPSHTSTEKQSVNDDDDNDNEVVDDSTNKSFKEDLEEILKDDDDDDNDAPRPEEDPSMVAAYDEFNIVQQQNQTANNDNNNNGEQAGNTDDDQQQQQGEQGENKKWQDHGVLLSVERKTEKHPPQHFDYFLLIDFECTCDEHPGFDNEIIEMPALLYDTKKLSVVAEFHTYIKPLRNPVLTPFCHQLTGIRQDQVENAPCYDEALSSLVTWLQETLFNLTGARRTDGSRLCVATDGPCDLEVFGYLFMHIRDGFNFPNFFQRYLDVKQVYRDEYGDGKYWKIKDMLARFGLRFEGNQHSGIDDTRNLATIVTNMIRRGTVFEEVYYVNNVSGRRRVPAYIWTKAKNTVRRATEKRKTGLGPVMADRCRKGLLGLSEREIAELNSSSFSVQKLMATLKRFAFVRIKVRANEFSIAPSTVFLVLMLCVFVASFFINKNATTMTTLGIVDETLVTKESMK